MRNFRLIALLGFVLLSTSCDFEAPRKAKSSSPAKATQNTSQLPDASEILPQKDFNWLTDETAPEFLLQYGKEHKERKFRIETDYGNIDILLSDLTPIHTANFTYLALEKNYFDGTFFYRVKPQFIIQGGDADNERIQEKRFTIGNYGLDPEFHPSLFHKRGAVAMSRNYSNNPNKRSTPFDFYIVVGKPMSNYILFEHQRDKKYTFPKDHFQHYLKHGGTPHLDQEHTVFGEVIDGMEVVDRISKLEADASEWPKVDVEMKVYPIP